MNPKLLTAVVCPLRNRLSNGIGSMTAQASNCCFAFFFAIRIMCSTNRS